MSRKNYISLIKNLCCCPRILLQACRARLRQNQLRQRCCNDEAILHYLLISTQSCSNHVWSLPFKIVHKLNSCAILLIKFILFNFFSFPVLYLETVENCIFLILNFLKSLNATLLQACLTTLYCHLTLLPCIIIFYCRIVLQHCISTLRFNFALKHCCNFYCNLTLRLCCRLHCNLIATLHCNPKLNLVANLHCSLAATSITTLHSNLTF